MNRYHSVLYANITDDIKEKAVKEYEKALREGYPKGQSISIATNRTFNLTSEEWNDKIGTNAFSTVCAILVMSGHIFSNNDH